MFSWHQQHWQQQQLERELAAAREELQAMHELLEELPKIFEHKFQGRMQPLLEQQHRLLRDNAALRQRVQQLLPQPTAALLPASLDTLDDATELSPQPPEQATPPARSRWRSLLPWRRPGG